MVGNCLFHVEQAAADWSPVCETSVSIVPVARRVSGQKDELLLRAQSPERVNTATVALLAHFCTDISTTTCIFVSNSGLHVKYV